MQLTQKETSLLKDMKSQEKLCVDKYTKHASVALDAQLKELCTKVANVEQQHYNTLCEIEKGGTPAAGGGQPLSMTFKATYGMGDTPDKQSDCYLCSDLLATEKHASSVYNTAIFEFAQEPLRNTLNHIQSEEQQHGKLIYDYMTANNMYS